MTNRDEKLREALEFYASRANYNDEPIGNNQWKTAAAVFDGGKRARAALAALSHPAPDVPATWRVCEDITCEGNPCTAALPSSEEIEAIRARNRRNLVGVTIDNPPKIEVTDVCDLLRLLDAARAELAEERAANTQLKDLCLAAGYLYKGGGVFPMKGAMSLRLLKAGGAFGKDAT
jgi:hypothetical protein